MYAFFGRVEVFILISEPESYFLSMKKNLLQFIFSAFGSHNLSVINSRASENHVLKYSGFVDTYGGRGVGYGAGQTEFFYGRG